MRNAGEPQGLVQDAEISLEPLHLSGQAVETTRQRRASSRSARVHPEASTGARTSGFRAVAQPALAPNTKQLFAAGWSGCFLSAIQFRFPVAQNLPFRRRLDVTRSAPTVGYWSDMDRPE
jgi:organic hydroperoxide reductase OsmC/OhrA